MPAKSNPTRAKKSVRYKLSTQQARITGAQHYNIPSVHYELVEKPSKYKINVTRISGEEVGVEAEKISWSVR